MYQSGREERCNYGAVDHEQVTKACGILSDFKTEMGDEVKGFLCRQRNVCVGTHQTQTTSKFKRGAS